jgi:hypothetical protein
MHRHYDLCARAVDPLEIAAGLEAHGITDRVAARFRHRDVFALAEELFARVPRQTEEERVPPHADGDMTARQILLHLLPGLACVAGVAVAHLPGAPAAPWVGAGTLAAVVLAAGAAVRSGPLRSAGAGRWRAVWTCWLLAFALFGQAALATVLGTPGQAALRGPDPETTAGLLTPAFALPPAAWLARRFAQRARAALQSAGGLAEFRSRVRPLLVGTLARFAVVVIVLPGLGHLLLAPGAHRPDLGALGGPALLALLLFTAQLLAVHGCRTAAALGVLGACAAEAVALTAAALRPLSGPAGALAAALGPAGVQAAACGAAALALVGYALPALSRAGAHDLDRGHPQPYDPAYAAALFASPHAYASGAGVR